MAKGKFLGMGMVKKAGLVCTGFLFALLTQAVTAEPSPGSEEKSAPLQATVAADKEGEPKTTFVTNTAKIFGRWQGSSLKAGDVIRAIWIAEAFGKEERDAKITEGRVTADRPDERGIFSLARPEGGWPIGRYRLEIYIGEKLAAAVKFKIEEDVTVQVE
jgi:hypothetical protein